MFYYKAVIEGKLVGLTSCPHRVNIESFVEISADEYEFLGGRLPYVLETPAELRENAYNTEQLVPWEGSYITVTEASQKWQYYAAEGNVKADELQMLIAAAKAEIRAKYPDEEVAV